MKVKIRPLEENDAAISYKWRNNPGIWRYTINKPERSITHDIELDWIRDALKRPNEQRFAICVGDDGRYIGNVQLANINNRTAQCHIFIGDVSYHGKGIGTKSILLLLEYAFSVLDLDSVYAFINKNNISSIKSFGKCGFLQLEEIDETIKMEVINERNQK